MGSPSKGGENHMRIAGRSLVIDSLRGCGLPGMRIDKEELKRKLLMPRYLRLAMRDSIRFKDPSANESHLGNGGAAAEISSSVDGEREEGEEKAPLDRPWARRTRKSLFHAMGKLFLSPITF